MRRRCGGRSVSTTSCYEIDDQLIMLAGSLIRGKLGGVCTVSCSAWCAVRGGGNAADPRNGTVTGDLSRC